MREKAFKMRAAAVLPALILLFLSGTAAFAGDGDLPKTLTGRWACAFYTGDTDQVAEGTYDDLAFMAFEEDGGLSLVLNRRDGQYAYTCEGTWTFGYVQDYSDKLRLTFTWTDNPAQAEGEYAAECVYEAYTESWVENDTLVTYLILTRVSDEGQNPFEDVYGEDDAWGLAFHREQGPNMKVVNCKEYVSLRKRPSASSGRLKRVPLGEKVLAFTEYEENGFYLCYYQDQEGYILKEYLELIEE